MPYVGTGFEGGPSGGNIFGKKKLIVLLLLISPQISPPEAEKIRMRRRRTIGSALVMEKVIEGLGDAFRDAINSLEVGQVGPRDRLGRAEMGQ